MGAVSKSRTDSRPHHYRWLYTKKKRKLLLVRLTMLLSLHYFWSRRIWFVYLAYQLPTLWEDDLQSIVQMGIAQNQPLNVPGGEIILERNIGHENKISVWCKICCWSVSNSAKLWYLIYRYTPKWPNESWAMTLYKFQLEFVIILPFWPSISTRPNMYISKIVHLDRRFTILRWRLRSILDDSYFSPYSGDCF